MNKIEERYRVAKLIAGKLAGTLTPEEGRELDAWAGENVEEYGYVEREVREELAWDEAVDVAREWKEFARRSGYGRRVTWKMWVRVAAVLAGVCVMAGMLVTRERPEPGKLTVANICGQVKDFKATLVLDDGREVVIQDSVRRVIAAAGGMEIVSASNELRYDGKDSVRGEDLVYNTLRIPRGGEYKLVMADGTTVWLNSESSLKYPVRFAGERREVWMEGEVCFDVAENKEHPFVVHVDKAEVKVLGTLFNVEAYPGEETITTTLVRGKVQVTRGEESRVMEPDEQVVIEGERFTMRKVVAGDFVRWTSGVFSFSEASLESIMDKLARWYDVEVFFSNASLKDLHITLEVRRYENIADILAKMEKMGLVRFDINNRTIVVRE